jgi:hypothetical protein
MNFNHLTDEQFAELLAGDNRDDRAALHVQRCEACRNELATLGTAVNDLNFASMRWAEQRAVRITVPSRWMLNWNALPGWGATMAAVLVFGVAIGAHMQTSNRMEPTLQPIRTVSAPSADELAQDNQLMRSIDSELSEQVGGQVLASDLDTDSHATHHRSVREVSN